jgi:tRNA(fMet)-specific endonuclease VapC
MRYLLDTDTCSDALRGRKEVIARMKEVSPEDCVVSSVTQFELLSGALKSSRPRSELTKVTHLLEALELRPFDHAAAERAAEVRFNLEQRGEKIGACDTLIAGHALALNLICATGNPNEFSRIPELTVEDWRAR